MLTETLNSSLSTVAQLVNSAQLGDRDAQTALYERYRESAVALAYRKIGNWDEAEELVQDVFMHAFDRLSQLRVPEAFGGWLRQIVRRMAINRMTRRRAAISLDCEALEALNISEGTPLDEILDTERCAQVRCGLQRLGATDRATLEAFYIGGQSLIEMAEQFAAPIGTIKRRLHVARKRLAREMENFHAI
ncbi:MAG: sigma-70 family RNA polymerase sigma factor [Planctomycetales bacterium]|nr:sigma-70 family RNA polymerase sigma factor [Planctomycetales bacterium]